MLTLFLLAWPLVSALLPALLGNRHARRAAWFSTMVQLGATLYALYVFQPDAGVQFEINVPWIPQFGIGFHIGIDGISMAMVLLTNLLLPLIILSSSGYTYSRPSVFFSLALVMQAALVGVFVALDGFLYYVFWEMALVPIYFIVLLWGGENRVRVTFKFFIYTLLGSLFMLAAFIWLYHLTPDKSFDIASLLSVDPARPAQGWIFWAFFLAFAIKMPVWPFHTWQPDTYTTAPPQGTMLLAGIMLKMGIYSVIRWLLPIAPLGMEDWGQVAIVLAVTGIVYGAWIAIRQDNLKRLFAYSSISHVGLIAAGIFSVSTIVPMGMQARVIEHDVIAIQGAIIQMLAHGINVTGLFFAAQIIYSRTGTHELAKLGGIIHRAPRFATLLMIILLGSVALPLTNGFVGEFLLLRSVYDYHPWLGALSGITIIFGAVYMLRMYQRTMLGEPNAATENFADLNTSEMIVMTTLAGLVIFMGVYPKPFLQMSEPAVRALLEHVYQRNISLQ